MNVHGHNEELDNDETSKPFPQAWTGSGRVLGSGERVEGAAPTMVNLPAENNTPSFQPQNLMASTTQGFWSNNLEEQQPKWYHYLLMMTCPCFVGNPCSSVRKRDYLRLFTTFIFWVSIIQILYFIVEIIVEPGFAPYSQNSMIGPSGGTLIKLGAKFGPLIRYKYQIYRLFLPILMHGGIFHIVFNLLVQLTLGLSFEKQWRIEHENKIIGDAIGTIKMIIIYILSGLGSSMLSCVLLYNTISVGASGSICGVFGAKLSHIISRWTKTPFQIKVSELISIGMILMMTFLFSFSGNVDFAGHLGGFIVGVMIGFILFSNEWETKQVKIIIGIIFSILLIFYFFICTLILLVVY
eukprot:gene10509-3031_t